MGVKRKSSPAQLAALAKARKVALANRKRRAANKNKGKAPSRSNRGIGIKGFKSNFTPYARANKRSQTVGYNAGTILPGTNKRFVTGSYIRVENTTKKSAVDRAVGHITDAAIPHGTKRRQVRDYLKKNVTVTNPALRAAIGGAEVRLGTSRGAGPTVIVRRGKHKKSQQASRKSIKRYDTHARKLHAKRKPKPRAQRRGKNG